MPTIKVGLDTKSYHLLTALAVKERRPIAWQAEVLLTRLLAPAPDGPPQREELARAAEGHADDAGEA